MFTVARRAERALCPTQNLTLTAASSLNMENSHEESLLSAVEDFSPPPSPNPADFSDSDRDEREEEEPLGFGVHVCAALYSRQCC